MGRSRCLWVFLFLLAGCGISKYPGQPGIFTNKYSKIDFENLDGEGLYTYETSYDNRLNGPGMGVIVTKYYPGALTYTSNVRTNADGTLYRVKTEYNNARIEMLALPQQNQILLPPNSTILFYAEYDLSMDEVDDKNLAEADLFSPGWTLFNKVARQAARLKLDWLKAAELGPRNELQYELKSVSLGEHVFVPSQSVSVHSTFAQNGLQAQRVREVAGEFLQFFESTFPKGYKGIVRFETVKGASLGLPLGLHTRATAQAAGIQVIEGVGSEVLNATLKKYTME